MRSLTYYVACSVDGFIAQTDGSQDGFSLDAEYLTALFTAFPETVPSHLRELMNVHGDNNHFDTVLMGRKTYEVGLKEGIASPYSHLEQYVFSKSMRQSPSKDVEVVSDDAVEFVRSLKTLPGKGIWLCGGANLATELFTNRLIDRLILKVNPFLMGSGISLFAKGIQQTALELTEQQTYRNGVLLLHYRLLHYSLT
jgi:dihydrofolate reductase